MKKGKYLVVLALLVTGILAGCEEQQASTSFTGIQVSDTTVKKQEIAQTERFFGEIVSKESVTISSTVPGKIQKVAVSNGGYAEEGKLLFKIENKDIESSILQTQSAVGVSSANLEKVKSGVTEEEISAMEQNVHASRASLQAASKNLERLRVLWENGAISQQQYDQAQTDSKVAESKYQALVEQLEQMKAGPTSETVQVGKAQVAQAQASYYAAKSKVAELTIVSPISGIISNVHVEEGEFVNPGMPLATVSNLQEVYALIQVPESVFSKMTLGQQVSVNISSLTKTFAGKVQELNPDADKRSKLFQVKVLINNPDGLVKPGMTAQVMMPIEQKSMAVTIPLGAMINDKGESIVYVIEENVAKKRKIKTGIRTNKEVEVVSGLTVGEHVVLEGVEFVHDKEKVAVIEAGGQ